MRGGDRINQIISQEVSRCKAFLSSEKKNKGFQPVWLVQGTDPRTGASLSPLLNEEGRITRANDIRAAFAKKTNVFKVNNTFTTISGPFNSVEAHEKTSLE